MASTDVSAEAEILLRIDSDLDHAGTFDEEAGSDAADQLQLEAVSRAALARDCDALNRKAELLLQERRVLRVEVETLQCKIKSMQQENQDLRRNGVDIQARAEQEEEFISNTLLKKIHSLKKEKEHLATSYEEEEEFLTNDLTRKLFQLRKEKAELEHHLEHEQEQQVAQLHSRIEMLEMEAAEKQTALEQLHQDKVELENSLEQEQEAFVHRLWKRMEKLEWEKRSLQTQLSSNSSAGASPPAAIGPPPAAIEPPAPPHQDAKLMSMHVGNLKTEVLRLRRQLALGQSTQRERLASFAEDERVMQEENLRLRKKLQMEIDRREALCRHLSESESSLEMDDERQFNQQHRTRALSSPSLRPVSPAMHLLSVSAGTGCRECGQMVPAALFTAPSSGHATKGRPQ